MRAPVGNKTVKAKAAAVVASPVKKVCNKKTSTKSGKGKAPSSMTMKSSKEKNKEGGNDLQKKDGDVVYVVRLRQGVRIAYAVKASDHTKAANIQDLVNLIRNHDESVDHVGICTPILPRRALDGTNNRMMDGANFMRQLVQVVNVHEGEDDSPEAAKKWGTDIAQLLTDLSKVSPNPTTCSFGGDLTPASGPPPVDTYLRNRDVVDIALEFFYFEIIDGVFFNPICADELALYLECYFGSGPPLSADFFGRTADPRDFFREIKHLYRDCWWT
mmetsp:Transcript_7728/g.15577  ORF Transcript_7728/g.15577 Transcript_7728/m.15577 type:complete len:273 (+) Transcript_7728:126-944(+)